MVCSKNNEQSVLFGTNLWFCKYCTYNYTKSPVCEVYCQAVNIDIA